MSIIANHKYGDCGCGCNGKNVAGRKVGKVFWCLKSYGINSSKRYIQTSEAKQQGNLLRSKHHRIVKVQVVKNDDLERYFAIIATIIEANPYCTECGEWIPPKLYRAATAHIFPKGLFESVQSHPLNFLILGAGCCHDKTHTIATFKKMKVFRIAVARYLKFKHLITETHKYQTLFKEAIIELKHTSYGQSFN